MILKRINGFGGLSSRLDNASIQHVCVKKCGEIYLIPGMPETKSEGKPVAFIPDLVVGVNLILCIVIFLLGYLVYRRRYKIGALFIGIAFGMFGLSHLNTLFGSTLFPEVTFVLFRICGYLLVAVALYLWLREDHVAEN